jgi:hypothetical protein
MTDDYTIHVGDDATLPPPDVLYVRNGLQRILGADARVDVSVEDRCVVLELEDAERIVSALVALQMLGYELPARRESEAFYEARHELAAQIVVAMDIPNEISGVGLTDPDEAAAAVERTDH